MVRVLTSVVLFSVFFVLNGCSFIPSFAMKNTIRFEIDNNIPKRWLVYKNTWPKCANISEQKGKYITISDQCLVAPKGHVPREIVIEYAPWLTYGQQVEAGMGNSRSQFKTDDLPWDKQPSDEVLIAWNKMANAKREAALNQLPANAWKKIVLHPKETVSRWRWQPTIKDGKVKTGEIHYRITINPDNTHTVTEEFAWQTLFKIDMR